MRKLLIRRFLLPHGCTVIPAIPALRDIQLLGQRMYRSLSDIPCHVDMVDVFRKAVHLPAIVDETIQLQIATLWTQLDVIDEAAGLSAKRHRAQRPATIELVSLV